MGFYLLDRRNPYGDHFYTTRNNRLLAIVVHVTAGADDLDALNDLSAENVSGYAATTDRDVSWHSGSDADSWISLLPAHYTAWHASNYNSVTYGHEISKRTTDWRNVPENWIDKTLRMAAVGPDGNGGLRKVAADNGIPLRWATKAELDHARATGGGPVGFITHAEIQWADRRDPGYVTEGGRTFDTFPRDRFMNLLRGGPANNLLEEDDAMDRLVRASGRKDCYIVSITADGQWKRQLKEPELIFLQGCGVTLHVRPAAEIDAIGTRSGTGQGVWNYGIPSGDSAAPYTDAYQVVDSINRNTRPPKETPA